MHFYTDEANLVLWRNWLTQLTHNQEILGSSPSWTTRDMASAIKK